MKTTMWGEQAFSRLMLGTVQFGMPYGVANRTGQPTYADALTMIATAVEGGVNCFDTAAAYGTSEEVLGRALKELNVVEEVTVVTKVRALTPDELADATAGSKAIETSVGESRRRLQLDCLPLVLFHREADAKYADILESLQQRGWLKRFGVSCDNQPGPAAKFVGRGCFSALQIPGNILDQRHLKSGVFQFAKAQEVAVFVRSVYLQGLLLMPELDVPPVLEPVIPVRRQLEGLARDAGMSLAEMALRYMLSQPGVTCVITGVETVEQVKENLAMFERGALCQDLLEKIATGTTELSESILTPGMWPKKS